MLSLIAGDAWRPQEAGDSYSWLVASNQLCGLLCLWGREDDENPQTTPWPSFTSNVSGVSPDSEGSEGWWEAVWTCLDPDSSSLWSRLLQPWDSAKVVSPWRAFVLLCLLCSYPPPKFCLNEWMSKELGGVTKSLRGETHKTLHLRSSSPSAQAAFRRHHPYWPRHHPFSRTAIPVFFQRRVLKGTGKGHKIAHHHWEGRGKKPGSEPPISCPISCCLWVISRHST